MKYPLNLYLDFLFLISGSNMVIVYIMNGVFYGIFSGIILGMFYKFINEPFSLPDFILVIFFILFLNIISYFVYNKE